MEWKDKKVLFVSSFTGGGGWISMAYHIDFLRSVGASSTLLLTLFDNPATPKIDDIEIHKIPLANLRKVFFMPVHRHRIVSSVYKLIKSDRFDVVFSYTDIFHYYTGLVTSRFNIPFVPFVCGRDKFRARPIASYYIRKGLTIADAVAFVSKPLVKDFVEYHKIPSLPTSFIIYPPVDTDRFVPKPDRPGSGAPVVLSVSRFVPSKRHDLLLAAFQRVLQQIPSARLVLVGDGPTLPRSKKIAAELGISHRVEFVGHSDNVVKFYQSADVFVHTALYEGFGMVITEALACGVPVVTSSEGGPREILSGDVGGFLVEPSLEKIAEKIVLLLCDPELRRRMGKAGRKRVIDKFSFAAYKRNLMQLHKFVLRERKNGTR